MASSVHGDANFEGSPQFAAFRALVIKVIDASVLGRHARDAELSSQAATQAEALFPEHSLVVAHLRNGESAALKSLTPKASREEKDALLRRAWTSTRAAIAVLQPRMANNTLLPGAVRKEEAEYYAYEQQATFVASQQPVPPPDVLQGVATTVGYVVLLNALIRSLDFLSNLFRPLWPAEQQTSVEAFVLQALDFIPQTANVMTHALVESTLVEMMDGYVKPQNYEPGFCAAVRRKWRSEAVSSVLRARGVLQAGVATSRALSAMFDARRHDDIVQNGLRKCALPSCDKTEKTVKEFSLCAGCRSQVYCCLEHQKLDWTAHKTACREKQAARLAAEKA